MEFVMIQKTKALKTQINVSTQLHQLMLFDYHMSSDKQIYKSRQYTFHKAQKMNLIFITGNFGYEASHCP